MSCPRGLSPVAIEAEVYQPSSHTSCLDMYSGQFRLRDGDTSQNRNQTHLSRISVRPMPSRISYKANRMVGGKAPSDYLMQLQNHKSVMLEDEGMDELLRSHFIDPTFLRNNDFTDFLESRRRLLISEIAKVMGKPAVETGDAIPDDDPDDE